MEITIRRATEADIPGILDIVNGYATQNLMLPRTTEQIQRVLNWFLVGDDNGRVAGCGSLVELTPQLTELRSLAVGPDYRGTGLGKRLVKSLVEWAREAGYPQICALTLREDFFNGLGFATVDRWTITPKIWLECVYCPKFDACDEIAVVMNLVPESEAPVEHPTLSATAWSRLLLARRW